MYNIIISESICGCFSRSLREMATTTNWRKAKLNSEDTHRVGGETAGLGEKQYFDDPIKRLRAEESQDTSLW
jgi:hypothetical protein